MRFDTTVKMKVYEAIAQTGRVPAASEVAGMLEVSFADVEVAFAELAGKRLLVLEPGAPGKIRMAPPFSGVETLFVVRVGEISYFANCVWDALGVVAALHEDGVVEASDGHTGEPMRLEVKGGRPVPQECAIHFAVPAARWWDDIIHT
ncbi:MAG: organomercurial lyase [Thermoanaerobaculia bacterium]